MKNKKGFTLIELLAVIILLAVIALIAYPIVDNAIKKSKEQAYEQTIKGILDSAKQYATLNNLGYNTNQRVLELSTLKNEGYLKDEDIRSPIDNTILNGCILYNWNAVKEQYIFEYKEPCEINPYVDGTGANEPELLNKMIPVKYENNSWIYADIYSEWYNYGKKEWANAVILKTNSKIYIVGDSISMDDIDMMFVWIPRYKYTIFNGSNDTVNIQQIDVIFESGIEKTGTVRCIDAISGSGASTEICTDSANGNIVNGTSTYTHPAFTFGDKELTGIWVGKFENSTPDNTCLSSTEACFGVLPINIKPNKVSWQNNNVYNYSISIHNITTNYSLTNADSHMMKNMEWGAVTYLKQSKYGLGITEMGVNDSFSFITGCGSPTFDGWTEECNSYNTTLGQTASTTGNVYGIYDMSGGAHEYVMGTIVNQSNAFLANNSGFTNAPDSKYINLYTYGNTYSTFSRGRLGDATKEILTSLDHTQSGWYNNNSAFPFSPTYTWMVRGGSYGTAGIFVFDLETGGPAGCVSSRTVLVNQ